MSVIIKTSYQAHFQALQLNCAAIASHSIFLHPPPALAKFASDLKAFEEEICIEM